MGWNHQLDTVLAFFRIKTNCFYIPRCNVQKASKSAHHASIICNICPVWREGFPLQGACLFRTHFSPVFVVPTAIQWNTAESVFSLFSHFALRGVNFWTGEVHQWTISFHLMESDMISTSNLLVLVTLLVEFKYCFLKAYVVRNVDKIFCFSSFKSPLEAGLGLMVIDSILIFNS